MGEQFDQEMENLRKLDYEYEQLLAKAKVKALKENDMQVYGDLEAKKLNRAALKLYLYGDPNAQKKSVDLDEINKDWKGKDLGNKAYGEFWKDDIGIQRRGSAKRSR